MCYDEREAGKLASTPPFLLPLKTSKTLTTFLVLLSFLSIGDHLTSGVSHARFLPYYKKKKHKFPSIADVAVKFTNYLLFYPVMCFTTNTRKCKGL